MKIQLHPIDRALQDRLDSDPLYREAHETDNWPLLAERMTRLADGLEPAAAADDRPHWGGFLVIDRAYGKVIGTCAYKGAPDREGSVEIAYFTFPGFESRGYATAMAQSLILRAAASPEVRQVIAHTLPEANASTHILEKVGMRFTGEVMDPEDGRVWRWRLRIAT